MLPDEYHSSSAVTSVASSPGGVSITLESGEQRCGDLLVDCDGPGSLVRHTFLPDVTSEYQARCMAMWHGVGFSLESDLPPHVVQFIANKLTVQQLPCSHILAYVIPGADGSAEPGHRRVNWVWYWNTLEEQLPELFQGADGHQHLYSVPCGSLRQEVAAERKGLAQEVLAPTMADVVCGTAEVFVQAIHDMLPPKMVLSARCCLLGDSACILRPHTAAGTTKAGVNAMALAACLQHHRFAQKPALQVYETSQLQLAEYLVGVGCRIGMQSQFPDKAQLRLPRGGSRVASGRSNTG